MNTPEEDIARALHLALLREFNATLTNISIDGEGVSWHCTARRDDSYCEISCVSHKGSEYYTSFRRNAAVAANSRTSSQDDTIAAVRDWLDGRSLSELYARYSFIDREKRALSQLHKALLDRTPELRTHVQSELDSDFFDIYSLHFHARDRSCLINFYGRNEQPDASFSWDNCQLFQFQPGDNEALAKVLRRWICDRAMPSEMRIEFPWLTIGKLADYYECGQPVQGEFIRSWDFIEHFYKEAWCTFSESVLSMIHTMREAGYDHTLRAGQSLTSLGLSRSRRHGLRAGQPSLWFHFSLPYMRVQADFANLSLEQHPIKLTAEVKQLLDELVKHDIR